MLVLHHIVLDMEGESGLTTRKVIADTQGIVVPSKMHSVPRHEHNSREAVHVERL